jgi:membrane protein DedA with SNARE-associated domain
MGRWGGHRFLGSGNRWQHRVQKANRLLERHQSWIVLGYRFLYGLRAVIPFLIGATGYSFRRFFLLSCIGGIVWSITITLAGIAFGKIVLAVLSDIQQYQFWVLGFIGMIGILLWVIHSSD